MLKVLHEVEAEASATMDAQKTLLSQSGVPCQDLSLVDSIRARREKRQMQAGFLTMQEYGGTVEVLSILSTPLLSQI